MQVYINHCTKVRKEGNMRVRKISKLKIMLVLIGVAAFLFGPGMAEVRAITPEELCAAAQLYGEDTDGDGFTDFDECNGFEYPERAAIPFPGYYAFLNDPSMPRSAYLDPSIPDLFFILIRDPVNSLIPADPLEYVSHLGIALHEVDPETVAVRAMAESNTTYPDGTYKWQNAVRIAENLSISGCPSDDELGEAYWGTPNGWDEAAVYTERIRCHVTDVCGGGPCRDASGIEGTPPEYTELVDYSIKHTIAHELGHMVKLAADDNRRFGGHHYKGGTYVLLEQFVSYTDRKGEVTFYISTQYADRDLTDRQLGGQWE